MSAKAILVFCAQALLVQGIYSQCAGILGAALADDYALASNGLAYAAGLGPYGAGPIGFGAAPFGYGAAGYGPGCGLNVAPASGGGFAVTSTSPISPTGISVISENAIEGVLSVIGELPFLGAVAMEGTLPTAGAGGINYGCGGGAVGIVSEGIAPAYGPAAYPAGLGYGPAGLAGGLPYGPAGGLPYGAGLGGPGYGARGFGLGGCGGVY